jgi:glycosyltransferase involved in cell wall biosynthesis
MRHALKLNGFDRVTTVHNGIPPDEWPLADHSASKSGIGAAERPVVLLPGRLTAFKGTEALLDAVSRLSPADRPSLVFAGDNPRYEPALLAYAEKLGLRENVEITGWMDQAALRDAVSKADVVVTPSTYADPFNLGNIEAMSTGRPVVASSLGGGPEIVVDGETGYLVDPADQSTFATKLAALLSDPELRRRFGLAGRSRVEERFTLARQARLTMESYLRAVSA